jgi:hypothetical protein
MLLYKGIVSLFVNLNQYLNRSHYSLPQKGQYLLGKFPGTGSGVVVAGHFNKTGTRNQQLQIRAFSIISILITANDQNRQTGSHNRKVKAEINAVVFNF